MLSDPVGLVWPLAIALATFGVSAAATYALSRELVPFLRILDHPNARSLHATPVPRTGGVAVTIAIAVGLFLAEIAVGLPPDTVWLFAAACPVAIVSLIDDWRGVPVRARLATQLATAVLLLVAGLGWTGPWLPGNSLTPPAWLAPLLMVLFVVWMINLYNFMDGMDGLAGGMAVFGFGALALLGWRAGNAPYLLVNAIVCASALGFLTGNFPPARIFLGDLGSALIGLLAAMMILWGTRAGVIALWTGALAFSPFIVDATWTLLGRAARGERLWEAHRSHHYQRLVLAGWSRRRVLTRVYPLMAAAAASAVAAPRLPSREQWMLLAGWAVIYWLIHLRVEHTARAANGVGP